MRARPSPSSITTTTTTTTAVVVAGALAVNTISPKSRGTAERRVSSEFFLSPYISHPLLSFITNAHRLKHQQQHCSSGRSCITRGYNSFFALFSLVCRPWSILSLYLFHAHIDTSTRTPSKREHFFPFSSSSFFLSCCVLLYPDGCCYRSSSCN